MCLYKKISALVFFLMLLIAVPGLAQTDANPLLIKVSILPSAGSIQVDYEIRNAGKDAARHVTVTTFLARKTNHSESLGDLPGEGLARYKCDLDAADLLPGNYILATRVDFADQSNRPSRIYHFDSITWKEQSIKKSSAALTVHLKSPYFNRKSLRHPEGKFELTLKNNSPQPLEPVIIFFLPDGLTVSEPEKLYTLRTGEEQKEKIPMTIDSSVSVDSPFTVVAWSESNGIHSSQLIKGSIRVEESPIYFKWFIILSVILIVVVAVVYYFRRRKKTASA